MRDSYAIDKRSRDLIVSETDKNFFVEAGAGSGKTTMLVSRMVAMVEQGKPIDQICAITFTRAAAGEFYERFQKKLIERSNPAYVWQDTGFAGQLPAPTEESRQRCREALQNIDRCFMGTIDSFCGMLLSEHPFEAGVPSGAAVISDEEALLLYKQAYVDICKGTYDAAFPGLREQVLTFGGLFWKGEEVFADAMADIMEKRNITFHYNPRTCSDLDAELQQDRTQILGIVRGLLAHPEVMYDGNKDSRAAWEVLEDAYDNLNRRWSKNYQGVVKALKDLQKLSVVPGAEDICPALAGELIVAGKTGKSFFITCLQEGGLPDKLENLRYDLVMTTLFACVPVVEQLFREKGYLSYFDALYYLRNMLRKDAAEGGKLISYIYKHHRYFLIDEFQDTDPMQAEVFFYLTAEQPTEEWKNCVPKAGSLFIVGDPKQSIYRFRGADVASFLGVKSLFDGNLGEVLYLTQNFRSTRALCRYFNGVFTKMMPEVTENQSVFEEIPESPHVRTGQFGGVYSYDVITGNGASLHPELTDARQIGKIIKQLVDNPAYTVTNGEDKEPRPITYRDFMIITSSKRKLTPILRELDALGIPSKVEGKVLFEENEALREISRIYSCLAIGDRLSLYGALTGKVLGFVPGDIVTYTNLVDKIAMHPVEEPEAIGDPLCRQIAECINELCALSRETRILSPAALFTRIMEKFRIYEAVPAENMEIVYYTLELIRGKEATGEIVTAAHCAAYLEQLVSGETAEERCLSLSDSPNCVHLANLHKVKGLEAPIVILAEAYDFSATPQIRVERDGNRADGYLFRKQKELGNGIYADLFLTRQFPEQEAAETEAGKAETQRLIYVAATRARNALIIAERVKVGKEGTLVSAGRSKWAPLTEEGVHDFFLTVQKNAVKNTKKADKTERTAAELYAEAEATSALRNRSVEAPTFAGMTPSHISLPSRMEGDLDTMVVPHYVAPVRQTEEKSFRSARDVHRIPTVLGTCVHRLMEILVSTDTRRDRKALAAEIVEEFRCSESIGFEGPLRRALVQVAETVQNGGFPQENGSPADLLAVLAEAEEVHCEWPFSFREEVQGKTLVWNGIMDLVYKAGGKWYIVDYKTNLDGTDLENHYRSQLEAYIRAFKEITGEDAEARIYHIAV